MSDDLTLELRGVSEAQRVALTQFVKRIAFEDIERQAVDRGEAFAMRDAIVALQRALERAGYAPG